MRLTQMGDRSHPGGFWDIPSWIDVKGHYVYVVHGVASVLYVGATSHVLSRMATHAESSVWWEEAKSIQLVPFATRAEAFRREADLIVEFNPRYNVNRPFQAVPIPEASEQEQRRTREAWDRYRAIVDARDF